jgi:hypothetical protein
LSAVAVNAIRGVAIVAAGENAPVARSKISALPITLPLRLSENGLIDAPPLKPPPSSTFDAAIGAATAPARLAAAGPVRKNCPLAGSKNSALARLRFDALAPPAISTSPAVGIAGTLPVVMLSGALAAAPSEAAPLSCEEIAILCPLMHPPSVTTPSIARAAIAVRAHAGLKSRLACNAIPRLQVAD